MAYPSTLTAACTDADCLALLVEHTLVMEELVAQREGIQREMRKALIIKPGTQ